MPVVIDAISVIAEGRLVPIEHVQLNFKSDGEIAEVFVAEGEQVRAGQILARLGDGARLEAAVLAARLELVSAQQALDALHESAPTMAAQAQLDLATARDELRKAEYKWNVQQEGLRASQSTINAAEAKLVLAKNQLDRAKAAFDSLSGRSKDNPARALALTKLAGAQQEYDAALRNLNWFTGHPTEIQQAMLDAEVATAQARLQETERVWEDLEHGPDPNMVELAEARLANAVSQLDAAQAGVADLELLAPIAGTVARVSIKAGESAAPGQVAIVLADFSGWMVETDNLTEIELPNIAEGQLVAVTFDALPDLELPGKVTAISPLFEIKRGDVTYAVEIQLMQGDPRLQWGMTTVVTFQEPAIGSVPSGSIYGAIRH
ncbi:MAG: efflux RND transporter periplasmic adaptor subunit [Chloroflexi bacterium]|nr:efflux RND transporter periplasmic adaptor subunit [Chloroflexota bacterium]